jgi:alkane 1-monooxygenase
LCGATRIGYYGGAWPVGAAVPHFLPFLLIVPTVLGASLGGPWVRRTAIIAYVVVVLADLAIGRARQMPPSERPRTRLINALPLWLWAPVQLGTAAWLLTEIHLGHLPRHLAVGVGAVFGLAAGAVGITVAHELVHRRAAWERLLGQALLVSVTYHHFWIEHVYGHHRRAGTPADPVTARRGEWLWTFLPRAIARSFVSAWKLEAARLAREGRLAWTPRNRVLAGVLAQAAFYAAVWLFAGRLGIYFLLMQSAVAIVLLETINYIEHYGLERRETAPGVYERYGPAHAWDSAHRFSNWILFNLPKHADHHLHPGLRHDQLVLEPAAPVLPFGYPLAILLAFVPPLWIRVMNRRLPPAPRAV